MAVDILKTTALADSRPSLVVDKAYSNFRAFFSKNVARLINECYHRISVRITKVNCLTLKELYQL